MSDGDLDFLKGFYKSLADRPLEPDEQWYVDLYPQQATDPVEQMATCIEWSDLESTQLFSGFRGSGKSTELRRLRARLHREGRYKVVLCDMVDYVNVASTIDIADFLISVAGAFGDALKEDPDLLGSDPSAESYWTRAAHFLRETEVDIVGVEPEATTPMLAGVLKANIRQDWSFRQRLREAMRGRLGALVQDVRGFMKDCVDRLRARHGQDTEVVLILDSIEQIRGTSLSSAEEIYASVEALFANHADGLQFEELHVVYTVPPWLKIRSAGIGGEYSGSQLLPCVMVRNRDGSPNAEGLDALRKVVGRRGDWRRLLGSEEALEHILLASGGYLRDLFRLLQSALRSARDQPLPIGMEGVELALHEVRNGYLPIARADAAWLARVNASHTPELAVLQVQEDEQANLYNLSRFFDTHMVLCYRDGDEWYDVHPLIVDECARQGAQPS